MMNYTENFTIYVLPALILGFQQLQVMITQFFSSVVGSTLIVFGFVYVCKLGITVIINMDH